jgi:hypothetical protein
MEISQPGSAKLASDAGRIAASIQYQKSLTMRLCTNQRGVYGAGSMPAA